MTRVVRLLAAMLLLATLTGAAMRGCAGEAGPAPKQQADSDAVYFLVRSSSFRVHVRATIGRKLIRDDPTVVPWKDGPHPVKPTDHVELRATLMDLGDEWVFCAILDKDGHEITSEEVHTPEDSAHCLLAPLAKGKP